MKVLVVGGGGREHVICWKLKQDPRITELYCAPGNGGIASIATCVNIKATDIDGMVEFAKKEQFDLVFVAPDDPLAMGMVDKLEEAGIRSFGPKANAAIIEGSKAFSKKLMKKYSIPTAKYEIFDDEQKALDYLETQPMPIVIKCDGLALGKGVIIAQNLDEAKQAVKDMMEDQKFGSAGSTIVIEECMTGPELTVLAFSDGNTCVPMVSSRDHKRAYDHDEGLNTGGMGAVTPGADMTDELKARIQNEIITPTVEALKKEGRPFKGVIYFGLMLTPEGPKVVEYNARFGDPEAQAVLPLLENSLTRSSSSGRISAPALLSWHPADIRRAMQRVTRSQVSIHAARSFSRQVPRSRTASSLHQADASSVYTMKQIPLMKLSTAHTKALPRSHSRTCTSVTT